MGGQTANLSVQILQLPLVRRLQIRDRITFCEDIRQAFERGLPPFAEHGWRKTILRCELVERFGFLQQLQDNLGFEGGGVRLFHRRSVRYSDLLTVQISGSTIVAQ